MSERREVGRVSSLVARRTAHAALAAALSLTALGCPPTAVQVPPTSQDAPPVITITNTSESGTGSLDSDSETTTTRVGGSQGTVVLILAKAVNPGGTRDFSMTIEQADSPTISVDSPQTLTSGGLAPTTAYILGTDGAGHTGSQAISFTVNAIPVTLTAKAVNFNGMSTTIQVTYYCPHCPVLKPGHG